MAGQIDYLEPFERFLNRELSQKLNELDQDCGADIIINESSIDYRLKDGMWRTTESLFLLPSDFVEDYMPDPLRAEIGDNFCRVRLVQITDGDMAVFVDGHFRYTLRFR